MPTRDTFNPMDLAPVLPNVVLVERMGVGCYEYRVAGTAVSERIQANPVGLNMLDYFVPEVQAFLTEWFEAMTFHPCAVLTRMQLVYGSDGNRSATVLGLPLLGKVARATIICLATRSGGHRKSTIWATTWAASCVPRTIH